MSSQNGNRRVVITGLGIISSIGIGWQEFWNNLTAGKSGISSINGIKGTDFNQGIAGQVKNFNLEQFFGNRSMSHLGRTSQMALASVKLALADSRIEISQLRDLKVGVSIGTTMGEPQVLEIMNNVLITHGQTEVDSKLAPVYPSHIISTSIGRNLSINGENLVLANACSAGNLSFAHSFDNIKLGKLEMMIAGGADSFSLMNLAGFSRLMAVAPEKCQPFDRNRKGMLVGEGAGIVIIESLESAKKRSAPIYSEILGYGLSCDAHSMTAPDVIGIKKAINKALVFCDLKPEEVDYICAHGTGTEQNDKNESQVVNDVFYRKGKRTPMSSIKSMLGHTMGAASAIENIACCLALKTNTIPPTINFERPDSECDIDCVPNKSRFANLNIVLNNSFAFGGNNACLVFKKYV